MKVLLNLFVLPVFLVSASSDAEETIIKPGSAKEGKRTLYRNPNANRKLDIDTSVPPPESTKRQLFSGETPYNGDALILSLITSGFKPGRREYKKEYVPPPSDIFQTRSYTAIASDEDITLVIPPNLQQTSLSTFNADTDRREYNTLQGSFFIVKSGLFRSSSIEMVPKTLVNARGKRPQAFRTTDLQPKYIPTINEDFQMFSKCTVTNSKTLSKILAHSCFYDVCLGSTTDCLNVYAGGSYLFSPFLQESGYGIFANNQNNGFLDPTDSQYAPCEFGRAPNGDCLPDPGPGGRRDLQSINRGPSIEFKNSIPKITLENDGSGMKELRAALPPSFPGFCIGGIGRFAGISCSMEVVTVAQRTVFPLSLETQAPTQSPTETDEPTNTGGGRGGRDLNEEEDEAETVLEDEEAHRNMQRIDEDENNNNGVLVQKIFISANMRLPFGPKAV